jgi:hypothetical protein
MAFSKIKDLKPGDTVLDRGRRFTVKQIIIHPETGMYDLIDTDNVRHGPYHPDEIIGIETRATGIRLSTPRCAEMLRNAERWDRRWPLSIARTIASQGMTGSFMPPCCTPPQPPGAPSRARGLSIRRHC